LRTKPDVPVSSHICFLELAHMVEKLRVLKTRGLDHENIFR
jgi:hypothetical protein